MVKSDCLTRRPTPSLLRRDTFEQHTLLCSLDVPPTNLGCTQWDECRTIFDLTALQWCLGLLHRACYSRYKACNFMQQFCTIMGI